MPDKLLIIIAISIVLLFTLILLLRRKNADSNKSKDISYVKAFNLLADGNIAGSMEELKKIALTSGYIPAVYAALAVLYRKSGDPVKAVYLNESLLVSDELDEKDTSEVLKELYKCYLMAGSPLNAKELISKIPDNPELLPVKAMIDAHHNDYEGAVKLYQKYEKIKKHSYSKEIANLYFDMGEAADDAANKIKAYKQAITAYKEHKSSHYALAEVYFSEGKKNAGIDVLMNIINANLIKSKEDINFLENAFYANSSIDELAKIMEEKIVNEEAHPAPYYFIYMYNIKKGNIAYGVGILKNYLTKKHNMILLREYLKYTEDKVLASSVVITDVFVCTYCHSKFSSFTQTCPICGNIDSFDFL